MATLGYTATPTFGQFGEGWNVGDQVALAATMPSPGGTLTTLHAYAATFAGTATLILVVWDVSGNVLASVNASSSSGTTPGWIAGTLGGGGLYVASGTQVFIGWANPNNTSGNNGFNAFYDSTTGTVKWNLQTPVPGNILTGTNPTQLTGRAIGAYADYTPLAAPTISSISPNVAPPGSNVTITGTNFLHASSVTIGGVSASFSITDDSHITATVPSSVGGVVTVTVTNPAGSGSSTMTAGQVYYGDAGSAVHSIAAVWYGDAGGVPHKVAGVWIGDAGGVPHRRW